MFTGKVEKSHCPSLTSAFERAWIAAGSREAGAYFAGCGSEPSLRIGLGAALSYGPLRNVLGRLRAEAPELTVRFLEGPDHWIAGQVGRGVLDIAFVQAPVVARGCTSEELWNEPVMAAVAENHELASGNGVTRDALKKETFLALADERGVIAAASRITRILGGRPKLIVPTPVHRDTLMNLVGLGYGLAFVSSSGLGAFYPGVAYKTIDGPTPHIAVSAIWRPDMIERKAVALLDAARQEGREGSRR
jgi:DNA-binding transcriptional LysR family regulator